jgi:hypothetical protein
MHSIVITFSVVTPGLDRLCCIKFYVPIKLKKLLFIKGINELISTKNRHREEGYSPTRRSSLISYCLDCHALLARRARNDAEYVIKAGVDNFMQQSRLDHGVQAFCFYTINVIPAKAGIHSKLSKKGGSLPAQG